MSVDGRLYDSAVPTNGLLDASVAMTIQVLNPAKTCILYEEQQTVSTLLSDGYFNVRVGSPTSGSDSLKRTGYDSGNSMATVFGNKSVAIPGRSSTGIVCSYTPSAQESRYFRFIVTPSTTGITSQLSPDMTIDSTPQALVAESLQGLAPTDFIQVNSNTTQAKADSLFGASYAGLTSLLSGTSSLYLQNSTAGTIIPNRATDPSSPVAGQIWYDTTANAMKYFDGTSIQTVGGGGADPTKLPLAGGTMAGNIAMGGNQITGAGHITQGAQSTLTFGKYTNAQEAVLTAALVAGNKGATWFNSDTNKMMYWDGSAAQVILDVASAGTVGDITGVTAGTGLTGGGASGGVTLSIDIGTGATQLFRNQDVPSCNANETLKMSAGPIYTLSCVTVDDTTKVVKSGDTMSGRLVMGPKGTVSGDGGSVSFTELAASGTNAATIRSPDALAADYVLTLPNDDGTSGQVLQTDGSGVLSWASAASLISADALDFDRFADSMTLDASTDIAASGTNVLSITNSGTGNSFVVNDQTADTSPFVIDANGQVGIGTSAPASNAHLDVLNSGNRNTDTEFRLGTSSLHAVSTAGGSTWNGLLISANATGYGNQVNSSFPSWYLDLGGRNQNGVSYDVDAFTVSRSAAGSNFSTSSELFKITSSGSVGVGTTTPGTLLDVAGAITSRPFGTSSGNTGQLILRELAASGTNTATLRSPDALAADYVLTLPIDDGSSGQVLQTDGSGVLSWTSGASSIGADALDFDKLSDSMTLDASTDIAASGTNVLSVTNSGTGNSFVVNDQAADTSPFVIDAGGQVGIGTSSPATKLSVGVSTFDGTYGTYQNSRVAASLNSSSFGGLQVTSNVNDATYGNYGLVMVNGVTTNYDMWGLIHDGPAKASGGLMFNYGYGTGASTSIHDYTTIMMLGKNGNVGIGTTVPGTRLDVAGAITSRPSGVASGNTGQLIMRELAANGTNTATIRSPDALAADYVLTLPNDDGTSGQVLQTDGSGVLSWTSGASSIGSNTLDFDKFADSMTLDASTDIAASGTNVLSVTNSGTGNSLVVNDQAADTSPFVIDASGNVGVATTAPSARLHVVGSGIGGANVIAQFSNSANSSRFQFLDENGTEPTKIHNGTANGMGLSGSVVSLWTGGTRRLQVTSSGDVGIGTSAPDAKLEVAGVIHSSVGGIQFPDGSIMTTSASATTGNSSTTDLSFAADTDADTVGEIAFSVRAVEAMRILNDGNIGIGTTVASGRLHVQGSSATIANFSNSSGAARFQFLDEAGSVPSRIFRTELGLELHYPQAAGLCRFGQLVRIGFM